MKIAKNVLEGVDGVEIYAIIGMLIFFIFFIGLIIWVIRLKKEDVKNNSHLPFAGEEDELSRDL